MKRLVNPAFIVAFLVIAYFVVVGIIVPAMQGLVKLLG